MLGYGGRQIVQVQVPVSGLCSGNGTSETISDGVVHKSLNSRERRNLEWQAKIHEKHLQGQHKREVRLAKSSDLDEVGDPSLLRDFVLAIFLPHTTH